MSGAQTGKSPQKSRRGLSPELDNALKGGGSPALSGTAIKVAGNPSGETLDPEAAGVVVSRGFEFGLDGSSKGKGLRELRSNEIQAASRNPILGTRPLWTSGSASLRDRTADPGSGSTGNVLTSSATAGRTDSPRPSPRQDHPRVNVNSPVFLSPPTVERSSPDTPLKSIKKAYIARPYSQDLSPLSRQYTGSTIKNDDLRPFDETTTTDDGKSTKRGSDFPSELEAPKGKKKKEKTQKKPRVWYIGFSGCSFFDGREPRTRQIMRYLEHAWIVNTILIFGTLYLLTFVLKRGYTDLDATDFTFTWAIAWIIPLPLAFMNFLGLITPFRINRYKSEKKKKKRARKLDNLYIVVVTRGDNKDTVLRSWEQHKHLEQIPKIRVHVLTDEPYNFENINCFACPKSFKCSARYKARALEWYRRIHKLTKNDWVLHLDEESVIDDYSVKRCLEFIKYSEYHYGQGLILYNQCYFWKKWLLTAADMIRVGDDLGRFHFQYEILNKSVLGCHGSFLLVNGRVENEVTWEMASFTEDYQFSITAKQLGYKCGQIDGIVREQSPQRFLDFMRQRRRWFVGISRTPIVSSKMWAILWFLGSFSTPVSIAAVILSLFAPNYVQIPRWIGLIVSFNATIFFILIYNGAILQAYDIRAGFLRGAIQVFLSLFLMVISSLMELVALIYSIIRPPSSFDVIKK